MLTKAVLFGIVVITLSFYPSMCSCTEEYKIGVLSNRGGDQALKQWKPTAAYLSQKLGKRFSIVPLGDEQMALWTKEGRLDFIYVNPAQYVELSKNCGIEAIATVVTDANSFSTDRFGSVIFARRDSGINDISDLKGKDLICRGPLAFGGWQAAKSLLLDSGINPETDFKRVRNTNSHFNVVYTVQYGVAQAGVVRTGILEEMADAGKIRMEDFRIIHPINDGFPLVHSTVLYPEFPLAICSKVPKEIRDQVEAALFELKPTHVAAKAAKIVGYRNPMDYAPVSLALSPKEKVAQERQ